MIGFCLPYMIAANTCMSEDKVRNMMKEFFPTLKRWKMQITERLIIL